AARRRALRPALSARLVAAGDAAAPDRSMGRGMAEVEANQSRAVRILRDVIESGRPLAYIPSPQEPPAPALRRGAPAKVFKPAAPLFIWSLTEGMRKDGSGQAKMLAPRAALDFVAAHDGPGIFLLLDFHEALRDQPEIRRRLRDLYEVGVAAKKLVVI